MNIYEGKGKIVFIKIYVHAKLSSGARCLLYGPRRDKTCLRVFVKDRLKPVSSATETI